MLITADLLRKHKACSDQVSLFESLFPLGLIPTVENMAEAASYDLDVWWAWKLLPDEGPGSKRAYAFWCAGQVAHLCDDQRVADCLDVVRRKVQNPETVSDETMRGAARAAARAAAAAEAAAAAAAAWAARAAAAAEAAGAAEAAAAAAAAWAARAAAAAEAAEAAGAAEAAEAAEAAWAAGAAWAAWATMQDAQLACLSQLLLEA